MTDTLKRLAGPVQPDKLLAGTAIYTPGAGVTALVKNVKITNNDPVYGAFLWGSIGALTTVVNRIIPGVYVPPGKSLIIPIDEVFSNAAGDVLNMRQSSMDAKEKLTAEDVAAAEVASTTDATSYATASWTEKNNAIYIMTVINTKASAPDAPNSFTDTHSGITWTLIQTIVNTGSTIRLSQYRAISTGTTATTTTVGFPATQTGCFIEIAELVGADTSGTHGSGGVQGLGTYESTTVSTVPFLIVPEFDCRTLVSAAAAGIAQSNTALAGWTQLNFGNFATPNASYAVEYGMFPASQITPIWSASAGLTATLGAFIGLMTTTKSLSVTVSGVEVT